jgi:hypothetical protein
MVIDVGQEFSTLFATEQNLKSSQLKLNIAQFSRKCQVREG